MEDKFPSLEDHKEAYHLYLKLVEVLRGEKEEISILALKKCIINIIMEDDDDNDTTKD